ncbi:hypothetical protein PINS_up005778 [Pythium insidiosum]|nr:hypothetical protein PINS_up005778 [Pythium insidiosum]
MFGRLFKSKDDGAKQTGPPGHRPGAGKPDEPPMGGGFFNLPPTVVKGGAPSASPGQSGPAPNAPPGSGLAYQHRPSGTGASGYAGGSYGGSSMASAQQQQPMGHGGPATSFSSSASSGGMDMFGGMSIKSGPSASAGYGAPSPMKPAPVPPHQYGGFGSHPGHAHPEHNASAMAAPAPSGGLFRYVRLIENNTRHQLL